MTRPIGIGFSKNENPFRAAHDAALQAAFAVKSEENPVNFVLVFSTVHYSRLEALEAIQQEFPAAKIVGCSTSGIILSNTIETRGLSVLALSAPEMRLTSHCLENLQEKDIADASHELAEQCLKSFGPYRRQASLLICDGLSKETPFLLNGLREKLGQLSPIIGAGSSDNFQYEKTYQYFQNRVLSDAAIVTLIGGQIGLGISSQHGWKPLGKPRIIDKSEKNIIQKINGQKAISLYEEFFQDQAASLFSSHLNRMRVFYPLGVSILGEKKYLLQNVSEVLSDGSLVCQSDIPQGSEVHIMIGNKDSCKQAARLAAQEAKEALPTKSPDVAIVLESASRQKLLGRHAFQEIQSIKDALGENVPIFGMYSYGEFAPFTAGVRTGRSFLQNETITIIAIEQRDVYQP